VKFAIVQIVRKFWKGVVYSRLSPFSVQDIPDPIIEYPDEVIVENLLSGICGTDMALLQAKIDLRVAPAALSKYDKMYLGHENLAKVMQVGGKVTGFEIGDRVTVVNEQHCHLLKLDACHACQKGLPFLCENSSIPSDQHMDIGGGFSEFWKYHQGQLIRVPDSISDELAVLTEPLSVAVRGVLRRPPNENSTVLVFGTGIIGQLTIIALKSLYPITKVYAIAKYNFQADIAKKYGAIPLQSPSWDDITEITKGKLHSGSLRNKMLIGGFDVIYDCVGNAQTINKALRWTKATGAVVLIGVNLYPMKVDLSPIWYQEVDLIGSLILGKEEYDNKIVDTYELAFSILGSGTIDADDLITHKFHLNDYKQAIKILQSKGKSEGIKVVFDFR
jgi:threonine dehydrogenase-like Zn-dependent dehydrogenase